MQVFLTRGLPRWVWIFTWLMLMLMAWLNYRTADLHFQPLTPVGSVLFLSLYVLFGVCYFWVSRDPAMHTRPSPAGRLLVTGMMSATVFSMGFLIPRYGDYGVLYALVASLAASQLNLRFTVLWVLVQSGLFAWTLYHRTELFHTLYLTVAFLVVKVFLISAVRAVRREKEARSELTESNAQLLTARERLAEVTRSAERVRISRELHDLLGHHLTALSMNLQVAERLLEPGTQLSDQQVSGGTATETPAREALEQVQRSRTVTRLLLADVREAVSSLREDVPLCFEQRVRQLMSDLPGLKVHLCVVGDLTVHDAPYAQALLRCIQEIATNTLRHARARHLWLTLMVTPEALRLEARDDGPGMRALRAGKRSTLRPGHGLNGMRERINELGGELTFGFRDGQGFEVRGWVPLLPPAAPVSSLPTARDLPIT